MGNKRQIKSLSPRADLRTGNNMDNEPEVDFIPTGKFNNFHHQTGRLTNPLEPNYQYPGMSEVLPGDVRATSRNQLL